MNERPLAEQIETNQRAIDVWESIEQAIIGQMDEEQRRDEYEQLGDELGVSQLMLSALYERRRKLKLKLQFDPSIPMKGESHG